MNNHRNITLDEIYNLMAEKMPRKVSDVSIEMYLTALYKVILEQLKIRGRISIRGFGTFYLDKREGQQKMMYNPKIKNKELVYYEPKMVIKFTPSESFDYAVNSNDFNIVKNLSKLKRKNSPKEKRTIGKNVVKLLNTSKERDNKKREEMGI